MRFIILSVILLSLIPLVQLSFADFPIHPLVTNARGLTVYDSKIWIINGGMDDKIFVYDLDGTRVSALDFTLNGVYPEGITVFNDKFYIVDRGLSLVLAYSPEGVYLPDDTFSIDSQDSMEQGIVYNPTNEIFLVVNNSPHYVFAYDTSGTRQSQYEFSLSEMTNPRDIAFYNNNYYVSDTSADKIFVYNTSGTRQPQLEFNTIPENPTPGGITFYNDFFYVSDSYAGMIFFYTFTGDRPGDKRLDPVDTLTASSTNPIQVTLVWETPIVSPPIDFSGYQINFTSPFGEPLTIITENTGNSDTTAVITNLETGIPFSFRVSAITKDGMTNIVNANIANTTTIHVLNIGDLQFSSANPNFLPIVFSRTDSNDETIIEIEYFRNLTLECYYDTKFNNISDNIVLVPTPISDTRQVAKITFINSTNNIVNIYCKDPSTDITSNYQIAQDELPFVTQLKKFQSGEYGTTGYFGALDLVSVGLIIIAGMIGFNRVNESVGIILTIVFMGIGIYFNVITYPAAIIPVFALVIMVVIASTKKV